MKLAKTSGLLLTILGIAVGFGGSVLGFYELGTACLAAGGVGALVAVAGALAQHFSSEPFIWDFAPEDWKPDDPSNQDLLIIPLSKHGRPKIVSARVEMLKEGKYGPVYCDQEMKEDGTFVLAIGRSSMCRPFHGRLTLG